MGLLSSEPRFLRQATSHAASLSPEYGTPVAIVPALPETIICGGILTGLCCRQIKKKLCHSRESGWSLSDLAYDSRSSSALGVAGGVLVRGD